METHPKTCEKIENGESTGCGQCYGCHDKTVSDVVMALECGFITEAAADAALAENSARYGVTPFSVQHGLAPYYEEEHRP